MPERTVAVASRSGLHARPAKIFVEVKNRPMTTIREIYKGGRSPPG